MAVERRPRTGRVIGRKVIEPLIPVSEMLSAKDDAKLKELMETCLTHNELMNAHKKTYETARKDLLDLMKKLKLKTHDHPNATVNKRQCYLEAVVETSEKRSIDINLLKDNVAPAVFLRCVSATIGDVTAEAGKAVADMCTKPEKGNTNVTVKARARK